MQAWPQVQDETVSKIVGGVEAEMDHPGSGNYLQGPNDTATLDLGGGSTDA